MNNHVQYPIGNFFLQMCKYAYYLLIVLEQIEF
jgi:hypothetical protein